MKKCARTFVKFADFVCINLFVLTNLLKRSIFAKEMKNLVDNKAEEVKVTRKDINMKNFVIVLSIPVILYCIFKIIKTGLQKLDEKYKIQEYITPDFIEINENKPPLIRTIFELVALVQLELVSSEKKDLYYECLPKLILYACFLFSINFALILLVPFIWLTEKSDNKMKRIKKLRISVEGIKRTTCQNINKILKSLK